MEIIRSFPSSSVSELFSVEQEHKHNAAAAAVKNAVILVDILIIVHFHSFVFSLSEHSLHIP